MIVTPMTTFLVRSAKYRISPRRLIGSRGFPISDRQCAGQVWSPRRSLGEIGGRYAVGRAQRRHAPSPLIETRVRGSTIT